MQPGGRFALGPRDPETQEKEDGMRRGEVLALAFAAGLAAPLVAEEPGGMITGVLGGVAGVWEIAPGQSDFSGDAGYASVSLLARGTEGAATDTRLMVGFEMVDGAASAVEIRLFDALGVAWYGPVEENGAVGVTAAEFGDGLNIEATLGGMLAVSEDFGRTLDPDLRTEIQADIVARVAPLD
jgi:hypothetical protein